TEDYYLVINNILGVTSYHLIYVNNNWIPAGNIKTGDTLFDIAGNTIAVTSIEKVFKKVPTFNLEIDQHHKFFANDILVHNGKVCASPWVNNNDYNDYNDLIDFLDDNSIIFSGSSLSGVMPIYTPGSYDSPLFSLKTATSIDETPTTWDINYLGSSHDSSEKPETIIDVTVVENVGFTLFEDYV
ncbi:unnamed protein product, partial [marine sediment metagenome]